MCDSTFFGRFLAHHQELTTALATSGFAAEAWWLSVVGRVLETTVNNAATTTLQRKNQRLLMQL
jgi:hypothetical protein